MGYLVSAAGCHHISIRAEGHCCGQTNVRAECGYTLAITEIEDTNGVVLRSRYDLQALRVRVELYRADDVCVVTETVRAEAARHVPNSNGTVRRSSHNKSTCIKN